MDTPQNEQSFDENVKQIMQALPPVIRAYLEQGKYSLVTKRLMAKYSLRIDQGGILEREIMLLIMGIEDPTEFVTALVSEATIADDTARQILTDVNQEIFVPLREEMRKQSQGSAPAPAAQQARPGVPPATTYSRPASAALTPPPPPASRPSLASVPSLIPQVKKPSINILRKEPAPAVPVQPQTARPMLSQTQQIRPYVAPAAAAPRATPPAPTTLAGAVSAALSSGLPANTIQHPPLVPPLPTSESGPRPSSVGAAQEAPASPASTQTPAPAPKPVPPQKSYGADPYREPIE